MRGEGNSLDLFASFHGVSVHGQDQGTDTLSRCVAGKRGGACVSPLLGSAGPIFTHQMHPLQLYLEVDQAPQVQHVQTASAVLSHTQPASARAPSACTAPSVSQPPAPRSACTSASSSAPRQPEPRLLISLPAHPQPDCFSPDCVTTASLLHGGKRPVVFHFCPRTHSAHFLVLTKEISEKCRSENIISWL